jgi:hypothetical protein
VTRAAAVVLCAAVAAVVSSAPASAGRRTPTTPTDTTMVHRAPTQEELLRIPGGIGFGLFIERPSHLFGDPVTARVEVVLNPKRVDPASVELDVDFPPYRLAAPVVRTERTVRGAMEIGFRYRLMCLRPACRPPVGGTKTFRFDAAVLTYHRRPLGQPGRLLARWYPVTVASRLSRDLALRADWQARENPPPPVTYTADATDVSRVLWAAAALLGLVGAFLVARAALPAARAWLARRDHRRLRPVHRELAMLRDAVREGGASEQRTALDALAVALGTNGNGDLAHGARRLAWSEGGPGVDDALALADEVESRLGGGRRS